MSPEDQDRIQDIPKLISVRKKTISALRYELKSLLERERVEKLGFERMFLYHFRLGQYIAQHDHEVSPLNEAGLIFSHNYPFDVLLRPARYEKEGNLENEYFASLGAFLRQRRLVVTQISGAVHIAPEEGFWE